MSKCNQFNQSSFQRSAITPKMSPSRSYQFKENLPYVPYQRSISSSDIYNGDIYAQTKDNNYLQTIPEENYNPYSRTILRRNYNGRASSNLNNYANNINDYYHMNSNNSFRNDSYYNNTDIIQRNFFGDSYRNEKNNRNITLDTNSYEYKEVPIYPQKAVDINIQPPLNMRNSFDYRNYNREYDVNDRYYNPNVYNMSTNRSVDYQNMRIPAIKKRSYYDNYTPDMKSHYKDTFIWYGKNKFDYNNMYFP